MTERPKLDIVNFKKDAYVIIEGAVKADRFFIIKEGNVQLFKEGDGENNPEDTLLEPGDFFGVISTMSAHSHIETAQALSDVALIPIYRNQFEGLVQHNTPIAVKIIQQFSSQLRYLNINLATLTHKDTIVEEDPLLLFKLGQYCEKNKQKAAAYYAYHQYTVYYPEGEHLRKARERLAALMPYGESVQFAFDPSEMSRSYAKDTLLFAEGECGEELFVITGGSVRITKIVDDSEVILAILKTGDMFGEMAILESKPRSANAIAHEDCSVLVIKKANFESIAAAQPQLITRLTETLADRIWFIYKQIANALLEDPLGRVYDAMLIHLEKNRVNVSEATSYTFNFGLKDFLGMAGIPLADTNTVSGELLKNKKIQLFGNKIEISDITEIVIQSEYYRKKQRLKEKRQAGR